MRKKIQKIQMFVPYFDNEITLGKQYKGHDVINIEKTVMGTFITLANGSKIEICNTPFMIFYKEIYD